MIPNKSFGPDATTTPPAMDDSPAERFKAPGNGADHGSAAGNLARLLERHRSESHAIVIQNYPDPDAIACAVAHSLIAAAYDIHCDILHSGKVSHPQNLAMVQLLAIPLMAYESGIDLKQYDGAVFVDNQGSTSEELVEALEAAGVPTLVVVDHHEPQHRLEPAFSDIRKTGAAATLYAEYLEEGLVKLDREKKEHIIAATALHLGLLTDTNQLLAATPDDYLAARYLAQYSDRELLQKVMAQSRPKHTMEVIRRALGNRVIIDGFSIAGVEYLRPEDRDAVPQAADFLLTEENVHTAIVYGILRKEKSNETLTGSLRTTKLTLAPDKFLKDVLGQDEAGHAYGGGKESAGGFEIPIGFLSAGQSKEFEDRKWQVYDEQIKNKLFNNIGADRAED